MKRFYISDNHFAHRNIISYCNRPFETVHEMDKFMIDKWNSVVDKDDLVIHGGDFALSSRDYYTHLWFKVLNGEKILVKGNHDGSTRWLEMIGVKVYPNYRCSEDNTFVIHDPSSIEIQAIERYDMTLLYGHIHDKVLNNPPLNSFNICVEHMDYTPKTIQQIRNLSNRTA